MLTLLAAAFAADLPSTGENNTTDAAVVVGVGDYLRVEDVPDAGAFAAFAASTLGIPGSRIWQPRNKNKERIEEAVDQAGRKVRCGFSSRPSAPLIPRREREPPTHDVASPSGHPWGSDWNHRRPMPHRLEQNRRIR